VFVIDHLNFTPLPSFVEEGFGWTAEEQQKDIARDSFISAPNSALN
jgi:hypothetical protein